MPAYDNKKLKEELVELDVIDKDQLEDAFVKAKKENITLGEKLLSTNLIGKEILGKIIGDMLDRPYANFDNLFVSKKALALIPEIVAQKHQIVSFSFDDSGVHLATTNPNDAQIIKFIEKKTGFKPVVYYTTEVDISKALGLYSKNIGVAFKDIITKYIEEAKGSKPGEVEPPIIKIVDTIIEYSNSNKSSDIHIEPTELNSLVRFRIDGVLHDVIELPIDLHEQIVTRIKVLANLRTDEHQAAQDGKIVYKSDDKKKVKLDLRVSIVPVTGGEKIVMRLLSEESRRYSLEGLGLSESSLEKVNEATKKSHGMILSTGPTGSGKTTTLYSILKTLNNRDVNIMTIEDPVEYDMEGVNQIQVNTKTELTFAKGLRSIVRQDPDIILVGEIRDEETAGIAINAAMTGHLVLSTLHTNDAATTFPRLIDMKVEPFLVASGINIVIAQRLVRKICQSCRVSVENPTQELGRYLNADLIQKHFGDTGNKTIYKGKGCEVCHHTGYVGRIGIFEVLLIDEEIKKTITENKDSGEINKVAIAAGMTTMMEDGIEKAKQGLTTVEEVVRTTKE